MNKDSLLNRLADVEKAITQTLANYNALEGSKQEIRFWLNQIEAEDLKIKNQNMNNSEIS